ncbi:Smr/MutS family protein [Paracoccus sp. SCSIO 75233]|uniref:Smr/MutS family protein n=1 Tax=Paracoccus sp. SCSIO 75233 TaxID=3017782 RepID=UPI0022F0C6E9|nr:Smr/MutS family protein [Paracoccus sp. SCSIO 75233]WBU52888.1 Smr/MutS family protein [Paracoccus sp. SCSIO 75233]
MPRRRGLSSEDRELWSRVTRSATPLHPKPRKDTPAPEPERKKAVPVVPRAPQDFLEERRFRIGAGGKTKPQKHDLAPSPAQALSAHPLRMDRKVHKQMTRGKLRPEAKLDLHGMTLAEAGPELARFILSCHARGFRLVLVITGKGSRAADPGPLPTRPGALRHQVPHWLHSPPLSQVVQQVSSAHLRHGGEGAYYVYLRR